jgi:peroxiredoxin
VPEDRFGDLGAEPAPREDEPAPEQRVSAAERFAELDATDPEPKPKRPEAPRPSGRYTWVFGVAALIVIVIVGIKVAQNGTGASLRGPTPGTVLPAFAAPAAIGGAEGDANVKQHAGDSNSAGKQPACSVRGPAIVNSCELRAKPLVLTFIVTRGADCTPQLDRIQAAQKRYPQVTFAALVSGDKTSQVGGLVRKHGWTFPVGVDHDGAVVNLYSIGVCPSTVFVRQGGRVAETKLGNLDDRDLAEGIARITRK